MKKKGREINLDEENSKISKTLFKKLWQLILEIETDLHRQSSLKVMETLHLAFIAIELAGSRLTELESLELAQLNSKISDHIKKHKKLLAEYLCRY